MPTDTLQAIEEIRCLKARYFRFVDTKDWDGLRSLFTPDAHIDLSYAQTPTDRHGSTVAIDGVRPPAPNPEAIIDLDEFVASASRALGDAVSVHHGHMPEIEVTSPDSATGIWPMEDMIRWPLGSPIRSLHAFGHYHERYVRLSDGWRIKSLKLTRLRVDSDPPAGDIGKLTSEGG